MRDWQGKRYWLVGASEGLGRALALQLSRVGARVVVSARTESRLRDLIDEIPGHGGFVPMDVTDAASVAAAAEEVGEVDGLVYLAGAYRPVRAQDWDSEQVLTMADTNFMGALRVIGAVLPGMVARGQGHIVLTGALDGMRGRPGLQGYGASKAAVMHLAESLRADLSGSGVDVQLVIPGPIRTRMTAQDQGDTPFLMEPEAAARIYFEAMNEESFRRSYPLVASFLSRAGQILPDGLWYRLSARRGRAASKG